MLVRRGKHLSLAENFAFLEAADFARRYPCAVCLGWRAAGCFAHYAHRLLASVALASALPKLIAYLAADRS